MSLNWLVVQRLMRMGTQPPAAHQGALDSPAVAMEGGQKGWAAGGAWEARVGVGGTG